MTQANTMSPTPRPPRLGGDVAATHHTFLHVVLRASVVPSVKQSREESHHQEETS